MNLTLKLSWTNPDNGETFAYKEEVKVDSPTDLERVAVPVLLEWAESLRGTE